MFYEFIDDLLFLSMRDSEYMAGHKIYDVSSVLIPFMEEKFIDRQYSSGLFGPDQLCAVNGIQFFQTGQMFLTVFFNISGQVWKAAWNSLQ